MLKSLGIDHQVLLDAYICACLRNQTFERQWKMCSTGLNACNLGYGGQRHGTWLSHRCHGKHGEHRKNCTSGRVEPGIRVTLTLRGSKIAWGGCIDLKTTPIASFWSKGLRKNTEVWLLPSNFVKSDTPPPPSIETSTRNKGHRSKIAFMSTQYRTHAKWWGIAGDARRERALLPHVFRHFLHFFLVQSVMDVWNNGS